MTPQRQKTHLRRKADGYTQAAAIQEKPRCEICGKRAVAAHHILTKGSASALRYDFENLACLCEDCHTEVHAGTELKERLIESRGGQEWEDEMKRRGAALAKRSLDYYREVIRELETRLETTAL